MCGKSNENGIDNEKPGGGSTEEQTVFNKDVQRTIKVFSIIIDPVITRPIGGDAGAIGKRWHEYFMHPKYKTKWNDPRDLALQYQREMEKASGGTIKFEVTQIEADTAWFCTKGAKPYSMRELEDFMAIDNNFWFTYEDGRFPLGESWQYKNMVEYYGLDTKRDNDEVHEVWVLGTPIMCMYESVHVSRKGLWCNGTPVTDVTNRKILTVLGYNYERGLAEMVHDNVHRAENMLKYAYNGVWRTDYEKVVPDDVELNNWELYSIYDKMLKKSSKHKSSFGNCHYPPTALEGYGYYNDTTVLSYAYAWKDYPYIDLDKREPQPLRSKTTWNCEHEKFCLWWFANLPNKEGINPADGRLNNWWYYIFDYENACAADNAENVY
jgi:hypothetical protein